MHPPPLLSRRFLVGAAAASLATPVVAQRAYVPTRPYPQIVVRPPATTQGQPIQLWTGEIGGTFLKIGSDLSVVAAEEGVLVNAATSHGSVENLHALIAVKGADLALVGTDSLDYMAQDPEFRPQLASIRYIARLFGSEFHLIARDPGIRTVTDLAGKRICTDTVGSGTRVTAGHVLEMFNISAEIVADNPGRALMRLRRGEIDAMAYVIGKPGVMFKSFPTDGLHLVEIPLTDAVVARYVPATFTHADYPDMVPEGHEVGSIADGAVMACYGWPAGTERYRNLERFVRALVAKLPEMQEPPFHPKWREVSLAADVPGLRRFEAVGPAIQAAHDAAEEAFTTFLNSIRRSDASAADRENLRKTFSDLLSKR